MSLIAINILKSESLEKKYLKLLHKQEPKERYRQICPEHEEEIEWLELPTTNGRLDDIPYCASCNKPIVEWFVLDSVKDCIVASGSISKEEDEE